MKSRIYLDNAATTKMDPDVVEAMLPYLLQHFGNPSAVYSFGRETRLAIETARKTVAKLLNTSPDTITFTSGGTESNNTAITAAVRDLGCTHIITSAIEHDSVLHTVQYYERSKQVTVGYVALLPNGHIDLDNLTQQLASIKKKTLVTLMHANNEIGNLLDLEAVSAICKKNDAVFHTDGVQTIGHYPIDLTSLDIDFMSGAGHKFHGPKGTGILYVNEQLKTTPLLYGGGQERNKRSGTENVAGICGFVKALEIAMSNHDEDAKQILTLKTYLQKQLAGQFQGVQFNGDTSDKSLYTVLNASFPKTNKSELLFFEMDKKGICISGGSACAGSGISHVMRALGKENYVNIRFSFSRYTTRDEVNLALDHLYECV